jgi:hypothetical protein
VLPGLIYALCAVAATACAVLLLRGYRASGARLLLWGGLCFVGLTVNNVLVFVDLLIVPQIDLLTWRNLAALAGTALLVWGLIWDTQSGGSGMHSGGSPLGGPEDLA